jgi:hypothetical protein
MVGHHLPELGDLDVEDVDQLDLGGHDRRVGVLHRRRLVQLLGAQRLPDRGDLSVEVTAAGPPQRGEDRGPWQAGGAGRVRCPVQQFQCLAGGQVVEGLQGGREELAQRGAQPQHLPGAVPDQALMRPGDQLDRLGEGLSPATWR